MFKLKHLALSAAMAVGLVAAPLASCTTVGNALGSFTHASATQATTLGQALQLAKIATDTADLAVNNATLSRDVLGKIKSGNDAVHTALTSLELANAQGQSLSFGAFNAAYAAFVAYAAEQNIPLAN